ncbi:unnamed protein product [Bursaphelenchus xylophilus]|uniref:(pine wood nematode) hypothetical protein n=1 Tax=Bursaphelenchus xylophilus TaxID=6326 RepID=A0A1I7RYJ4_BURXY|nr:unnamed protein product [Bursaphelenchus xylophilus]CAG9092618.1 unnamed protein product [Bursaphelenchus xylophilus]
MPGAVVAPVIVEQTAQKPVRYGIFRTLRNNFHWKCLASTFLIAACFAYVGWCHIKPYIYFNEPELSKLHGPCANAYKYVPLGFAGLLYIIYLFECWHNRSKLSCIQRGTVSQLLDQIDRLRTSTPVVWWKSICYHYIRRTKHVTRYRNGDAVSATQVYYERVNSHTSGNVFMYDMCGVKDISKDVYDVDDYPIVRVRFSKGFVFACVQAADEFEDQRTRFFNENELRDDYMEVREGLDFAETRFSERMLVFADETKKLPFYMRSGFYWTCCCLLLAWPLRVFIDWRTAHLHYQVTKLFGTNYLSPSSINYTGPLTRVSTIDTIDLERANQQNYLIVPSYSEAVLMDPIHTNYSSSIRLRPTNNNEPTVIANYGAIGEDDNNNADFYMYSRDLNRNYVPRSRSMSSSFKSRDFSTPIPSANPPPLPRPSNFPHLSFGVPPPRSLSISGTFQNINSPYGGNDENQSLLNSSRDPFVSTVFRPPPVNEPPPPYEVAIRICAPLYQRIRQSANDSISSLLNVLSRSSSKDFRQNGNGYVYSNVNNNNGEDEEEKDEPGSSKTSL